MAKPKQTVPGAEKAPGTTKQNGPIPPIQPPVPPATELKTPPTPLSEPSVAELTPPAPSVETPPVVPLVPPVVPPPAAPQATNKKKSAEEIAKEKLIVGYRKQYPNNRVFYLTSDGQVFLADAQNLAALHQRSLKSGEIETINE